MQVFMVERDLNGITIEDLAALQQTQMLKAREMTRDGTPVRYIRSAFVPEDSRCMCLFEARSDDDVRRLNDDARLPYRRVLRALDLTPTGLQLVAAEISAGTH